MKIALCIPWSSPFLFTGFWDGNCNMRCPGGCEMRWFRGQGFSPARRHVECCEKALAWDADLIVILGADQMHPENTIEQLYRRHQEGYEVVTALVPSRGHMLHADMRPYQPLAWKLNGGKPALVDPQDGDVQEIFTIGSGVLMFHRDHLLALKKPWFFDELADKERWERKGNMDSTFVQRLRTEAHARIWVDTTLKIKHLNVEAIDDSWMETRHEPSPDQVGTGSGQNMADEQPDQLPSRSGVGDGEPDRQRDRPERCGIESCGCA